MQLFWLRSLISEDLAPPPWDRLITVDSAENVPTDNSVLIAEIACEADSVRATYLLEQTRFAIPVWIFDPVATVGSSVAWMKSGAAHVAGEVRELSMAFDAMDTNAYIPDCHAEGLSSDRPALRHCPTGTIAPAAGSAMVGISRSMREVQNAIRMVADRQCTVLIEGETGTGKEVVAREIHATGSRRHGPWVAVNCSAIPEALLEAELFGYLKGAFTGAQQSRTGKFEAANHGTIFLDEIGDMPIGVQAKLLRVLQEREIERLGGNERVRLDIRVIAATNVDLAGRVKEGTFRQDLFYRLNVFQIPLPPLRERPDDFVLLARHFLRKVCANERIPLKTLDPSAVDRLRSQSWPGNVRELENAIETAVIVSCNRAVIFAVDLRSLQSTLPTPCRAVKSASLPPEGVDYQRALEDFEVGMLTQALTRVRGNKTAAADLLGLKRTTLAAKMKALESRFPLLAA